MRLNKQLTGGFSDILNPKVFSKQIRLVKHNRPADVSLACSIWWYLWPVNGKKKEVCHHWTGFSRSCVVVWLELPCRHLRENKKELSLSVSVKGKEVCGWDTGFSSLRHIPSWDGRGHQAELLVWLQRARKQGRMGEQHTVARCPLSQGTCSSLFSPH